MAIELSGARQTKEQTVVPEKPKRPFICHGWRDMSLSAAGEVANCLNQEF
ncbi:hypothetical protein [Cohaesibacter sp. ES.047]|nr:hypothetical protein [Cohaesibacter sp. ES.047]